MKTAILTALFTLCLSTSAATITTSASCGGSVDPNYCSIGSAFGSAQATFTDQATASDYVSAALLTYSRPWAGDASIVNTSATITADLSTVGTERSGFMQVLADIPNSYVTADGAYGLTSVSIGSYSLVCGWSIAGPQCTGWSSGRTLNLLVPFTLGVPFSVDLTQHIYAVNAEGGFGGGRSSVQFRFFEADGVTPVSDPEVSDAPEPATCAVVGLGFIGMLLTRKRSKAQF